MLESILRAAGLRTAAVGNIGVVARRRGDGPGRLRRARRRGRSAAAALPAHGEPAGLGVPQPRARPRRPASGRTRPTATPRRRIYRNTQVAAVYNVADPATERHGARRPTSSRAAVRSASPSASPACRCSGVVDDLLVDRAFIENRADNAQELASVHDVRPFAPHNVGNALAAAALARAYGVPASAVREGLRSFEPAGHRIADVATVDGVRWVDDSKATNGHAAATSLLRLRLRGVDRRRAWPRARSSTSSCSAPRARCAAWCCSVSTAAVIREALARHAPDVPVVEVDRHRHWSHGRRRARRRRPGAPGRHRAAGTRVRVVGHVPRLRPPR